ncbi:COX15/CtaA family protein [Pilimelia columellifera]|uniref:COX15/CtaA family protein n=1 Tax=Pilimelia columellifera subsp. columellifera TaxID=706583 RepID=A0ABN3N8V8_9ACTN
MTVTSPSTGGSPQVDGATHAQRPPDGRPGTAERAAPARALIRVRQLALASLIANTAIVATGGAVRLTGSGLGCPTWPRCTDDSLVATAEMGIHGAIEFGNRLLTIVLSAIAVAGLVAAWRLAGRPRRLVRPALLALAGIAAQGVVGGITVWMTLHPLVVGIHFMLSIGVISVAYEFWRRARDMIVAPPVADRSLRPLRPLAWTLAATSFAVLLVGTLVTGSGPHSGDPDAPRNGLDPQNISQIHADLVFLLLGLSVAAWLILRAWGAPAVAVEAAASLVLVELAQGLIGLVQYFTGLPVLLVGAHLVGACLVWIATLAVLDRGGALDDAVGRKAATSGR